MVEVRATAVLVFLLVAGLGAGAANARDGDRAQPATIEADRVEVLRPEGVSHYYGDVVFIQGSLRITGAEMTLRAPGGAVEFAETIGEPATVRQQTDAGEIVDAEGQHIEYQADAQLITLTGDAVMRRGGERFAAGRIRYRTDTGRVEAGADGDGDGDDERVRIRIEPEPQPEAAE